MGAVCAKQRSDADDALLAAIRDGEDATVKEILATTMAKYKLAPGKYYSWAEHVSALHVAANEGHLGVLKALVELVAPPNDQSKAKEIRQFHQFLNKPNSYGQTSLMLACKSGHEDIVKYLLHMGADPLIPDKVHSRTCIHYAAWNGRHACIQVLLADDCVVRLHNGMTGAASRAIVQDACGCSRFVDMRSESGFTPLHFAVSGSKGEAVKVLLAKGASLTAEVLQSAYYSIWPAQSTSLHIAAAKGNYRIVRYLLLAQMQAGEACPELRVRRDANGRRPLDVAQMFSHPHITRLEFMLEPTTPLNRALSSHSQREAAAEGVLPLTVLAGRKVQEILLQELDLLAWQIRLRDGAEAAMPRNLKRQLMKSKKSGSLAESALPEPQADPQAELVERETTAQSLAVSEPATDVNEDPLVNRLSSEIDPGLNSGAQLIPLELILSKVGLSDSRAEEEEELEVRKVIEPDTEECGICLDRHPQLRVEPCMHECCHKCAAMFVRKAKTTKGPIKCPFCRGLISNFTLIERN